MVPIRWYRYLYWRSEISTALWNWHNFYWITGFCRVDKIVGGICRGKRCNNINPCCTGSYWSVVWTNKLIICASLRLAVSLWRRVASWRVWMVRRWRRCSGPPFHPSKRRNWPMEQRYQAAQGKRLGSGSKLGQISGSGFKLLVNWFLDSSSVIHIASCFPWRFIQKNQSVFCPVAAVSCY